MNYFKNRVPVIVAALVVSFLNGTASAEDVGDGKETKETYHCTFMPKLNDSSTEVSAVASCNRISSPSEGLAHPASDISTAKDVPVSLFAAAPKKLGLITEFDDAGFIERDECSTLMLKIGFLVSGVGWGVADVNFERSGISGVHEIWLPKKKSTEMGVTFDQVVSYIKTGAKPKEFQLYRQCGEEG